MAFSDPLVLALEHEDTIEWNDDPMRYPYLRQSVRTCYQWWGQISPGSRWATGVRTVGYAVLLPSASPRGTGGRSLVHRRIFWCKLADRDGTRLGPPAQEAVDPRRIRPRERTPWLFEDHDPAPRQAWLAARRSEMGLAGGGGVAAPGRPQGFLRPELTPQQPAE